MRGGSTVSNRGGSALDVADLLSATAWVRIEAIVPLSFFLLATLLLVLRETFGVPTNLYWVFFSLSLV